MAGLERRVQDLTKEDPGPAILSLQDTLLVRGRSGAGTWSNRPPRASGHHGGGEQYGYDEHGTGCGRGGYPGVEGVVPVVVGGRVPPVPEPLPCSYRELARPSPPASPATRPAPPANPCHPSCHPSDTPAGQTPVPVHPDTTVIGNLGYPVLDLMGGCV